MPPALPLQDNVAVPEPDTLLGLTLLQERELGTVLVRLTVPVNPFTAVMVIVELLDWPTFVGAAALAVIVKSGFGGPRGRTFKRHPQPMGLLLHWSAP